MVFIALIINLFIIIPLYEAVLNMPIENTIEAARAVNPAVDSLNSYLAMVFVPFNLTKAIMVALVFYPVFKRVKSTKIYKSYQKR